MAVTINADTSNGLVMTPDTSGEINLQAGGATIATVNSSGITMASGKTVADSTGTIYPLTLGTAVSTTSGTSIDITGIPSWVKRVTLILDGTRNDTGSRYLIQLGDSGGIETTDYLSTSMRLGDGGTVQALTDTSGFGCYTSSLSGAKVHALFTFVNVSGNTWVLNYSMRVRGSEVAVGGGGKTLSGTLDRIRLTTSSGTANFDNGQLNILYE